MCVCVCVCVCVCMCVCAFFLRKTKSGHFRILIYFHPAMSIDNEWTRSVVFVISIRIWRNPVKFGVIDSYQYSKRNGNKFIIQKIADFDVLKVIVALWCQLHWALHQEYLNIRSLNNLIALTELFPTPDWQDWRLHTHTHTHIYIYILYISSRCPKTMVVDYSYVEYMWDFMGVLLL